MLEKRRRGVGRFRNVFKVIELIVKELGFFYVGGVFDGVSIE